MSSDTQLDVMNYDMESDFDMKEMKITRAVAHVSENIMPGKILWFLTPLESGCRSTINTTWNTKVRC